MQVNGIRIELSKVVDGLWWDSDRRQYDPAGWGIVLQLAWGPMWWSKWGLTLKLPFIVGPYLSVAFGPYGLYLGLKNYKGKELIPSASIRRTRWL